ncbi:MAG: SH3 domain-containing protein [Thermodesulfobacteriota bacterium]
MNSSHPAISRITIAGFAVCLLFVFASSALAAEYVSIKKNGVNVRSGPSTKEQVRWEVFKTFPLKVLKREKDWVNCLDFEGDKGWVHENLLSNKKTVIVKKKKINLRDSPSTADDSRIIAVVKYGVVFKAIAKKRDWLKVRHQDTTEGWVHKDLIWPSDPLD